MCINIYLGLDVITLQIGEIFLPSPMKPTYKINNYSISREHKLISLKSTLTVWQAYKIKA